MFVIDLTLTKELEEFAQLYHDLMVRYGGWKNQKKVTATKLFIRGWCEYLSENIAEIDDDIQDAKSMLDNEDRVCELEDFRFKFAYIKQRLAAGGKSL